MAEVYFNKHDVLVVAKRLVDMVAAAETSRGGSVPFDADYGIKKAEEAVIEAGRKLIKPPDRLIPIPTENDALQIAESVRRCPGMGNKSAAIIADEVIRYFKNL